MTHIVEAVPSTWPLRMSSRSKRIRILPVIWEQSAIIRSVKYMMKQVIEQIGSTRSLQIGVLPKIW